MQQLPQQPLSLTVTDFHGQWKLPGKLDHAMIQEWHACLQAHPHACAVHLDQNVVWQIGHHVQVHHALREIRERRPLTFVCQKRRGLRSANYQRGRRFPMGHESSVERFRTLGDQQVSKPVNLVSRVPPRDSLWEYGSQTLEDGL